MASSADQSSSQKQIEGSRREQSARPKQNNYHHQQNQQQQQNHQQNNGHPHAQSNAFERRPNHYQNHYQNPNARPVRKKGGHFNEKPVFTCLVCCQDYPSFRHKAIFAIGPCNHMVCYYCSTKMRVLCDQSECPTCRQELSEVVI